MRRKLVAANWKMHGSRAVIEELIPAIIEGVGGVSADVAISPPFVYLEAAGRALQGSAIALGAQNVSAEASGAFTGEIAADMLRELACRYVIVGHSERRALFGEDDALVVRKAVQVLRCGMTPVFCVGETLAQREAGATLAVVGSQIGALLGALSSAELLRCVIAYEPVWAIGTGLTATPGQAQEVHAFIRGRCAEQGAADVRILYGGSVKADNAAELFAEPDIDGGLIGGASLNADEFTAICRAAE
ncbi:MAG: triose-phosphate isomerase [Spongiibacteraceae bacterium]|nr:triose-phosphate isomerase [Spongiibacteraceae bacterium]